MNGTNEGNVLVLYLLIQPADSTFWFNLMLQLLAAGLRTGETEWMEPLETTSAVELIKIYLEGMAIDIGFISIIICVL